MEKLNWKVVWAAVWLTLLLPAGAEVTASPPAGIYDADPNHLWNRLFAGFYRQNIANNTSARTDKGWAMNRVEEAHWVGPDVLDPPIGYHPRFLLDDEPFAKGNGLLDEFLRENGAGLMHDALKRAMLQHDLWAVFDVLAQAGKVTRIPMAEMGRDNRTYTNAQEEHRIILERKLAQVIRAMALSRAEIEKLPDTYGAAIKSGAFSDILETNRYNYLPRGLFAADSGWREIAPASFPGEPPQILEHTLVAGGRSVFRTFVKLPDGSKKTNVLANYVAGEARLMEAIKRHEQPKAPGLLPWGTRFLLLREMICLDEKWQMVPTHMVESVQIRTLYRTGSDHSAAWRSLAREAELSRELLFAGKQGGLRAIPAGEPRYRGYNNLGHLSVEQVTGNGPPQRNFPKNCGECHSATGELNTHVAEFVTPSRSVSIEPVERWKEEKGKLDLLRELIREK